MNANLITCPQCGHTFELSDALTHQIRDHFKTELQADVAKREAEAKRKLDDVRTREEELAKAKEALPPELKHFGQADGVWVCDSASVLPLAAALRRGLVTAAMARLAETGTTSAASSSASTSRLWWNRSSPCSKTSKRSAGPWRRPGPLAKNSWATPFSTPPNSTVGFRASPVRLPYRKSKRSNCPPTMLPLPHSSQAGRRRDSRRALLTTLFDESTVEVGVLGRFWRLYSQRPRKTNSVKSRTYVNGL